MEAFVIYPSQQFDWNFLVIYLLFIQLEQCFEKCAKTNKRVLKLNLLGDFLYHCVQLFFRILEVVITAPTIVQKVAARHNYYIWILPKIPGLKS